MPMHTLNLLRRLAVPLVFLSVASAARAQIAFNPLVGANGAPYAGHTENGFDVTVAPLFGGSWAEAHLFGNPVPSVFGGPLAGSTFGQLEVTRSGGGNFSFASLDLAAQNGFATYSIVGFLGLGPVLVQAGTVGPAAVFVTILSANSAAPMDRLVISLANDPANPPSSWNVDNIVVRPTAAVPEPGTTVLLAGGLALIAGGLARRRRVA